MAVGTPVRVTVGIAAAGVAVGTAKGVAVGDEAGVAVGIAKGVK